jgi:hypothetical protein
MVTRTERYEYVLRSNQPQHRESNGKTPPAMVPRGKRFQDLDEVITHLRPLPTVSLDLYKQYDVQVVRIKVIITDDEECSIPVVTARQAIWSGMPIFSTSNGDK